MRWLVVLVLLVFADSAGAQETSTAPLSETTTVTEYGPWTHAFETAEAAKAHLRAHPNIYAGPVATSAANSRDAKAVGWKIISVEIKRSEKYKNYPFRARATVEARLQPWARNVPKEVAKEKGEAETKGEKPIEDELEQRIAELEALDEETSQAVVDKLTSDLLDKINDVEVMQDTLVSVIARLTSKGPALGLWRGGKTAERYISRLSEVFERVQHVEDSLTGLHDHSMRKASSLFDGLMRDLDNLDNEIGIQNTWGNPDPDITAFWDAKDALRDSVYAAKNEALNYDTSMFNEQLDSVTRSMRRDRQVQEMRKNDFMKRRYGIDLTETEEDTSDEPKTDASAEARETLKSQLSPKPAPSALEEAPETDAPATAPMRTKKTQSPIRATARPGTPSEIRREAGADEGPKTMDADGGGMVAQPGEETAPRVKTPRVTSPFGLAREEKQREVQQRKEAQEAALRFNEQVWLDIGMRLQRAESEQLERYVVFGGWQDGAGKTEWQQCSDAKRSEFKRRKAQFEQICPYKNNPAVKNRHLNILYENLQKTCPGYYYVGDFSYRQYYPEDLRSAGAPEYEKWHMNEVFVRIDNEVDAQFGCGEAPESKYVRYGDPLHVVTSAQNSGRLEDELKSWASSVLPEGVGARVYSNIDEAPASVTDHTITPPDLSNAPFQLYQDSALRDLRDMQTEYQ